MTKLQEDKKREKTIPIVIELHRQGKTSREIEAELASRPDLYAYKAGSIRDILTGRKRVKPAPAPSPESPERPAEKTEELPEAEILSRIKTYLEEIKPAERPIGATGKGKTSPLQTAMVAARFPVELVSKLKALPGPTSYHLEKALMLYLKLVELSDPTEGDDR
jgi:hypothetical protein